jgi:hypothetical protein
MVGTLLITQTAFYMTTMRTTVLIGAIFVNEPCAPGYSTLPDVFGTLIHSITRRFGTPMFLTIFFLLSITLVASFQQTFLGVF